MLKAFADTYLPPAFHTSSGMQWLRIAAFLFLVVVIFVALRGVHRLVRRWFYEQEENQTGLARSAVNTVIAHTSPVATFIVAIAIAGGLTITPLYPQFDTKAILVVGIILQVAFWLSALVPIATRHYAQVSGTDASVITAIGIIAFLGRLIVWTAAFLLGLSNIGVDVTALIAGLGVGGIAIALATQNILGDVFSSLSIVLDRPFEVGDFIIVGPTLGTVERIGIKTTRIRSLGGEQIIVSNSDLLQSRIQNYKRMSQRRVVFKFGLAYGTDPEILRAVPGIVKGIIESLPNTRFDRCHLLVLAEANLTFEVVYYVLSADFNRYADLQHEIHVQIIEKFAELEATFAVTPRPAFFKAQ